MPAPKIKRKLSINRKRILEAHEEFDNLNSQVQREGKLQEQRNAHRKLGIEEKLKNTSLLQKESIIQARVDEQFTEIETWLKDYEGLFDLTFLQSENIQDLPNADIIFEVRHNLELLKKSLDSSIKQIKQKLDKDKESYLTAQKKWVKESSEIQDQLNEAIKRLPEQQGKSGKEIASNYRDIIRDLELIKRYKEQHRNRKELIASLDRERQTLLEEYRDTAFRRYEAKNIAAEALNEDELSGKIKIKLSHRKNIDSLKNFMKDLNGIGPQKIKWLDEIEKPIDLIQWAKWIREKSQSKFKENYGEFGLTDATIETLVSLDLEQCFKLEEIELEDTLSIELNVSYESNQPPRYVPLKNLSLGQKCTAILNLLLIKRDAPLIIDQPEDHLDNSFIAERIVEELRNLKTNRQFLFATHNANIPVFGDAELIVVLENESEKAIFKDVGSIDSPQICNQAAQILEGGKAAFDMRREKYGF